MAHVSIGPGWKELPEGKRSRFNWSLSVTMKEVL